MEQISLRNVALLKQSIYKGCPFFLQRNIRSFFADPVIPVICIPQIAFFPVQVSVYPCGGFIFNILDNVVGFFPVAFAVVPQCFKVIRYIRRVLVLQALLKLFKGHGSKIKKFRYADLFRLVFVPLALQRSIANNSIQNHGFIPAPILKKVSSLPFQVFGVFYGQCNT